MNVVDYLSWRGDLSFDAAPLNEVDALIFSWFSYYEMEYFGKLNIEIKGKTVSEIFELHKKCDWKMVNWVDPEASCDIAKNINPGETGSYIFSKAAVTTRFSECRLIDFYEKYDKDQVIQFGAASFEYAQGKRIVAFRGTDQSLIGWKEDCMLSYRTEIPGQKEAVLFFQKQDTGVDYVITGHSKGGNEALYCLLKCDEDHAGSVSALYNFDGPGFLEKLQETDRYKKVASKIHSYIPKDSVVGMLLEHEENFKVVKALNTGVMQHVALFWCVEGPHFVYEDNTSKTSKNLDKTFAAFLNNPELSLKEKEDLVDFMFSLFEKSGIKTIPEFSNDFWGNLGSVIQSLIEVDPSKKENARKLLWLLTKAGWESTFEKNKQK